MYELRVLTRQPVVLLGAIDSYRIFGVYSPGHKLTNTTTFAPDQTRLIFGDNATVLCLHGSIGESQPCVPSRDTDMQMRIAPVRVVLSVNDKFDNKSYLVNLHQMGHFPHAPFCDAPVPPNS